MIEYIAENREKIDLDIQNNSEKSTFLHYYLGLILLLFIIGTVTLFGANQLRLLGVIMVSSYILIFLIMKNPISIPLEIILYFCWMLWSILGYLVNFNIDHDRYMNDLRLNFQVWIMSFTIAGIVQYLRDMKIAFLACVIGGVVLLTLSTITGELQLGFDASQQYRTSGLTSNSNSFAYYLLIAVAALLFFWGKKGSGKIQVFKRVIVIFLVAILVMGILSSGSRKAFVGFGILFIFWMWMCYRKTIFRRPSVFISLVLVISALLFVTDYMLSETLMGKRFHKDLVEKQDKLDDQKRVIAYHEGLTVIRKNPFFGVGLDNFRFYNTVGMSSHSEYIEVAACTGIIGFIIYFSIYVVLWRRLNRIQNFVKNESILYNIGLLKATIITTLILGFGRTNYNTQIFWVLFASAIGYAFSLNKKLMQVN